MSSMSITPIQADMFKAFQDAVKLMRKAWSKLPRSILQNVPNTYSPKSSKKDIALYDKLLFNNNIYKKYKSKFEAISKQGEATIYSPQLAEAAYRFVAEDYGYYELSVNSKKQDWIELFIESTEDDDETINEFKASEIEKILKAKFKIGFYDS